MCHIFECITLGLDLIQRLITYFFVCFIFVIVYTLLSAALVAGMVYGYKYYLAEYYTFNSTLDNIRKIALDPNGTGFSEYDTKHYKDLIAYYDFQATSTEVVTDSEAQAAADAIRKSFDQDQLPQLPQNELLEDEMDRGTISSKEDIERPTVVPDSSEPAEEDEYMKKIHWMEPEDKQTVTRLDFSSIDREDENRADENRADENREVTAKHWKPVTIKHRESATRRRWRPKILKTKTSPMMLSEFAEDHNFLRYQLPFNKMADEKTSTTKKETGYKFLIDKLKSALSQNTVIRRTVEPQIYNTTNANSTSVIKVLNAKSPSESKVLSILLKHLTSVPFEDTTAADISEETSTERTSDYPSTRRLKEYERKLNLALSQKDDNTKEIIV